MVQYLSVLQDSEVLLRSGTRSRQPNSFLIFRGYRSDQIKAYICYHFTGVTCSPGPSFISYIHGRSKCDNNAALRTSLSFGLLQDSEAIIICASPIVSGLYTTQTNSAYQTPLNGLTLWRFLTGIREPWKNGISVQW
jgi:hypothetical protein